MPSSTTFGSIIKKAHIVRAGFIQQAHDKRVDTKRTEPVVPAMRTMRHFAEVCHRYLTGNVAAKRHVRGFFEVIKLFDSTSSRMRTMVFTLFGTSMPTAALPGIGASMRTPVAARFIARSSASVRDLADFHTAAGCTSYARNSRAAANIENFGFAHRSFSVFPQSSLPFVWSSSVSTAASTFLPEASIVTGGEDI